MQEQSDSEEYDEQDGLCELQDVEQFDVFFPLHDADMDEIDVVDDGQDEEEQSVAVGN